MAKRLKKIILLSLFGVLIFSFFNCEYEEHNHSHIQKNEIILKRITFKEIENNNQLINKFNNISKIRINNKITDKLNSRIINDTINDFSIDDQAGTLIENGDYKSYTFKINRENGSAYLLENLVVSQKGNNNYEVYLYQYDINDQELQMIKNNQDIDLSNKILITVLENNNLFDNIFSKEDFNSVCYVETTTYTAGQNCPNGHDWSYVQANANTGNQCIYFGSINGPLPGYYTTTTSLQPCNDNGGVSDTGNTGDNTSGENGGGGSGSTVITSPTTTCPECPEIDEDGTVTDHCNSLKKLITTANIQATFPLMVSNANNEQGYSFQVNQVNGINYYQNPQITGGVGNMLDIPSGSNIYGAIHIHLDELGDIFSFSDLYVLLDLYRKTSPNLKLEVVFMLKNKHGSIFALKINNVLALRNFTTGKIQELMNQGYAAKDALRILNDKTNFRVDDSIFNTGLNNEKDVVEQFLNFTENAGISLYQLKYNDTSQEWDSFEKISLPYNNQTADLTRTKCK